MSIIDSTNNKYVNMDWNRIPFSTYEEKLTADAFRQVLNFYQGMKDVSQHYASLASRKRLRLVINSIVLSVWDGYLANRAILIEQSEHTTTVVEQLGVEWRFVSNAVSALGGLGIVSVQMVAKPEAPGNPDFLVSAGKGFGDDLPDLKRSTLEHSQPLDVHAWSDHPEVNAFVDQIYEAHFATGNTTIRKKHLKVLLLDLYVCWSIDPSLKTGLSRNVNSYDAGSRYNELHISKLMPTIVDRLEEVGLIRQALGYYLHDRHSGMTTRIWPTGKLIRMFEDARFGPLDIGDHPDREVIILRDADPKKPKGKQIEVPYGDTGRIKGMRFLVERYNDLLHRTFIDIPTLEQRHIDLGSDSRGKQQRLLVSQHEKFTRRIFNRGSFDKGGRFFGGWWQRCPKEWRERIFINDKPTSELDYSGLHIVMLYAREGIDYWTEVGTDPYVIDLPDFEGTREQLRAIVKQLLLVALNARDEAATFAAFRDDADTGSVEKGMSNGILSYILNMLKEIHRPIAHMIANDAGIDLMNQDSEMVDHILRYFTRQRVPVLAIHDSFIVPYGLEKELDNQMQRAFAATLGTPGAKVKEVTSRPLRMFRLSASIPVLPSDLQGIIVMPRSKKQSDVFETSESKYQARINPERTPRYQADLRRFQAWLAEQRGEHIEHS